MAAPLVKVCGITRLEDALAAVDAGVDALGFNFWPGSKRYLAPAAAREIIEALPPFITIVGLFVDQPREEITKTARMARLQALQLHGALRPEDCLGYELPVVKGFAASSDLTTYELARYRLSAYLLDTPVPGHGGSGQVFDWALLDTLVVPGPLILAGGLRVENVAAAVARTKPYAVDVASGVERAPGVKDHELMRRFVANAKKGDGSLLLPTAPV